MYRPEIKVLDCTIRDGGLINNHQFDMDFVKKVYRASAGAGIDYFEIGYKNSKDLFSTEEYGLWKFCDDHIIEEVIQGIESKTKISCMVDIGRVNMDDIKNADESPVAMIRVACYVKDIDKAIAMANGFYEKGYETCINIMAISRDQGPELDEAFEQIERESHVIAVYLVDSFGYLYQETVSALTRRAKAIIKTKEVGVHFHNNQQLAFGNTIEAIIDGANYLDATIYGIGRAAGNCNLELLLGFLKNPKYDIRPLLDFISTDMLKLREEIEWGYILPYALAGMMNEHPRLAMALRNSDGKENYREFYETMQSTSTDCL
ncbi:MAG: aldolase catalytic domain-containing protein [Spirochaetaceae bacterium]|nr:aldolase catalytic domain-containing protein [Spirochaetaceae bacterium]